MSLVPDVVELSPAQIQEADELAQQTYARAARKEGKSLAVVDPKDGTYETIELV